MRLKLSLRGKLGVVNPKNEGAMATVVLRCGHASLESRPERGTPQFRPATCGHACSAIHMPTPEYQREHGTPKKRI